MSPDTCVRVSPLFSLPGAGATPRAAVAAHPQATPLSRYRTKLYDPTAGQGLLQPPSVVAAPQLLSSSTNTDQSLPQQTPEIVHINASTAGISSPEGMSSRWPLFQ